MAFGDLAYRLNPSRVALVVIDVQNDFCGPVSATGVERDNTAMKEMTAHLDELIPVARSSGVPVIFVRTVHDERVDSPVWLARSSDSHSYADENCKPGTDGVEFFCTPPLTDETIITKRRYDAFVGTELDQILRATYREAIVATGCLTDICVETTARHAVCLDYFVTVASDCCASSTPEAHDQALSRFGRSFGRVLDSAAVTAHWRR